jgi:hypothetical protein
METLRVADRLTVKTALEQWESAAQRFASLSLDFTTPTAS